MQVLFGKNKTQTKVNLNKSLIFELFDDYTRKTKQRKIVTRSVFFCAGVGELGTDYCTIILGRPLDPSRVKSFHFSLSNKHTVKY